MIKNTKTNFLLIQYKKIKLYKKFVLNDEIEIEKTKDKKKKKSHRK
jgi:hypothetical protein